MSTSRFDHGQFRRRLDQGRIKKIPVRLQAQRDMS
jgi:hypothetical protein